MKKLSDHEKKIRAFKKRLREPYKVSIKKLPNGCSTWLGYVTSNRKSISAPEVDEEYVFTVDPSTLKKPSELIPF